MNGVQMAENVVQEPIAQKRGISGSTIKIIAIVAMLIDHIGAVIVERMIMQSTGGMWSYDDPLVILDQVLRGIGRIGFPIFSFLLVEGFLHTRNVAKYALRLGIFALISEVPFDLAFAGKFFYMDYQNVFFTLFIGLLVMIAYRAIEEKISCTKGIKIFLYVLALVAGAVLAQILMTDYAAIGIVCIMVLYIFRKKRTNQLLAGSLVFMWEVPAPFAFIPIACYNGKRGLKMKYFFYLFYPVHLFILYLIAHFMGLA